MSGEQDEADPAFVVVLGSRSGERLAVAAGEHRLGRDADCDIRLDDAGVSRRHAVVIRAGDTTSIEDTGSTNGTFVNGSRVTSAFALRPGDQVSIGSVELRFQAATEPQVSASAQAAHAPSVRPRRRVSIIRIVLIGGLVNLVILAAGVVIQFSTDWTAFGPWLAAPLTGMFAALVEVGRETLTRKPEETYAPATGGNGDNRPTSAESIRPPRRRTPAIVGVLVAVLLVGVGGAAVTYAVATVSGFISGNQAGVPRLENGPVAVDSSGLVATVEAVDQTQDFTRVEITVQNNLGNTISLPLYGFVTLTSIDGTTLEPDPFRSSWSETIASGQLRRGTLIFHGHLPDDATTASLVFATVFGGGDGPESILVTGLEVGALQ